MTTRANNLFARSNVLQAEHKGGEVRITIGNVETNVGAGQQMPMWGMPGFVSMPELPNDDGATQVLYLNDGAHSIAIGFRDNRTAAKAGNPVYGDRFITSSGAARFMLKRADDSLTMYTANQEDKDSSMAVTMNGKSGEIAIVNGKAMIRMKTDEIVFSAGGCTVQIKNGTFAVYGKHAAFNVGGGNLGVIGIVPPPQGIGSILAGPAGMIGAPSTRWTVAIGFVLALNLARLLWLFQHVAAA